MKLKYNRIRELEVVGFGVFKPNAIITIEGEKEVKRYLDSGYFNLVKEKKKVKRKEKVEIAKEIIKPKYIPNILKLDVEKKIKKSKKKGVDK